MNHRERFDRFISVILKHEGGWVNDPDDRGGETKYGITRYRYPELDIKNLTIGQATDIYYRDFYQRMKLFYIKNDALAIHVFDMGVNAGRTRAVELLQSLLKGCEVDGILGPSTGQGISLADTTTNLVEAYKAKRVEYYYKVSLRGNNSKFLKGWVNRVNNT